MTKNRSDHRNHRPGRQLYLAELLTLTRANQVQWHQAAGHAASTPVRIDHLYPGFRMRVNPRLVLPLRRSHRCPTNLNPGIVQQVQPMRFLQPRRPEFMWR